MLQTSKEDSSNHWVEPRAPNSQARILPTSQKCLPALPCALLRQPRLLSTRLKWYLLLTPTHRFLIQPALCYSFSGRLILTLMALQRVAQVTWKQEEGTKLSIEVRTRTF